MPTEAEPCACSHTSLPCAHRISALIDQLLHEAERRVADAITGYQHYVENFLREAPRSRGEYVLDYLLTGTLLTEYAHVFCQIPLWLLDLDRELSRLGSISMLRVPANWLRHALQRPFSARNQPSSRLPEVQLSQLPRMLEWMHLNDFHREELLRLNNWHSYLSTLEAEASSFLLRESVSLSRWFHHAAQPVLGGRSATHAEPLSHTLALVGAELINRGQGGCYDARPQRMAIVPAQLRNRQRITLCQGHTNADGMVCPGCSQECDVYPFVAQLAESGGHVQVIHHGSVTGSWLGHKPINQQTGALVVHPLPQLLAAGLEARRRGIAVQLQPLP